MSDDSASTAASNDPKAAIKNVFVLMLENRSFDHMFGLSGIPGIHVANGASANVYQGRTHAFQGGAPNQAPSDPGHEFKDVVEQLCGAGAAYVPGKPYPATDNSGFVSNYATTSTEGKPPPLDSVGTVMQGIDAAAQTPALYQLATNYVLCDFWRASLPGPTWPNRYFLHGASSSGLDDSPTSADLAEWEAVKGFSYANGSIYDALGSGNYKLYQDDDNPLEPGRIPQVASLKGISFFDVDNLSHFADDLQNGYSYPYTFIEPSYGDVVHNTYEGGSSQHPMDGLSGGDQLIARVYNAIRKSPVWPSSLLVILYDEHGGFYDSAPIKAATPPGDGADGKLSKNGFDFSVLGVRVPAVIVSPWVGKGVVDHTEYDHSSVPATIGRLFGCGPLTQRDKQARDVLHLIAGSPRADSDCPASIGS